MEIQRRDLRRTKVWPCLCSFMRAEGSHSSSRQRNQRRSEEEGPVRAIFDSGQSKASFSRAFYAMVKIAATYRLLPHHLGRGPRGRDPESIRKYRAEVRRFAARHARQFPHSEQIADFTGIVLGRIPKLVEPRPWSVKLVTRRRPAARSRARTPRRARARTGLSRRTATRKGDPPGPPKHLGSRYEGGRP
jgi:hypothetical protein